MELLSIGLPAQLGNGDYSVHRDNNIRLSQLLPLYQHDSDLYIDDISMTGPEIIDDAIVVRTGRFETAIYINGRTAEPGRPQRLRILLMRP